MMGDIKTGWERDAQESVSQGRDMMLVLLSSFYAKVSYPCSSQSVK